VWAQLKLDRPRAIVKGDYFVVRSNHVTLGGGNVVEPHARRHRRNYRPILDRLALMERGTDREILTSSIQASEPAEFQDLANRANLDPATVRAELRQMAAENLAVLLGKKTVGPGLIIFTAAGWSALKEKAGAFLDRFHAQFPLRKGAPKEELRSRLGMTQQAFGHALPRLQDDGALAEEGPVVRRPDHVRGLTDEQRREADRYLALLRADPYSPPTDAALDADVMGVLADDGAIVRVSDAVVFDAAAYEDMVEKVRGRIGEGGQITVADVRDMFGASRKYALALLEHLDQQRITKRVGDARVLR
jgi:selenocysteine-specific elongation factor